MRHHNPLRERGTKPRLPELNALHSVRRFVRSTVLEPTPEHPNPKRERGTKHGSLPHRVVIKSTARYRQNG